MEDARDDGGVGEAEGSHNGRRPPGTNEVAKALLAEAEGLIEGRKP
jgi:hypothetical protein